MRSVDGMVKRLMNTQLIADYLKRLRREHDLTQEDLAEELHISRQAVSRWETGSALPDSEVLLQLSKLYRLSINEILEPDIPDQVIESFEQLTEISETELKNILRHFSEEDIVKASMGASPTVNDLLERHLPEIDFRQMQTQIGRVRVSDVEEIQRDITAFINVSIPTSNQSS